MTRRMPMTRTRFATSRLWPRAEGQSPPRRLRGSGRVRRPRSRLSRQAALLQIKTRAEVAHPQGRQWLSARRTLRRPLPRLPPRMIPTRAAPAAALAAVAIAWPLRRTEIEGGAAIVPGEVRLEDDVRPLTAPGVDKVTPGAAETVQRGPRVEEVAGTATGATAEGATTPATRARRKRRRGRGRSGREETEAAEAEEAGAPRPPPRGRWRGRTRR